MVTGSQASGLVFRVDDVQAQSLCDLLGENGGRPADFFPAGLGVDGVLIELCQLLTDHDPGLGQWFFWFWRNRGSRYFFFHMIPRLYQSSMM